MSVASPLPPTFMLPELLPSYSPSSAAPQYSPEPLQDEHRLVIVARKLVDSTPTGVFVKKVGNVTLVLSGQEGGVDLPRYARNGVIRGQVLLEDERNVKSVEIKLEGIRTLSVMGSGTDVAELFSEQRTLWSQSLPSTSTSTCPAVLPVELPFPQGCEGGQGRKPLPPSFTAQFHGSPGIYVQCQYTLTVTVTKTGLGGWKRQKSLTTEVCFRPRTRPFLPIGDELQPFFSTVKSAPGDWHQVISTMGVREGSPLQPIECHLFIPSVQIYALRDTIPFHLHLRGSPASLVAFLSGPSPSSPKLSRGFKALGSSLKVNSLSLSRQTSRASTASICSSQPSIDSVVSSTAPPLYTLRVYILRQVCVTLHGQKAWNDILLGEGTLRPLSGEYPQLRSDGTLGEHSLDWEGEVTCKNDVSVGGFSSGDLVVKDFIVVQLRPPPTEKDLQPHRHAHPIRLVTDSYADP
ncbi:hypothetical protein BXZ70DRAFT_630613 [Cristinia sonorae]|uniref:Arrestin-like N-terminal domain-containing protein n=1 Tax=Cristinia sonorae TaxID=1940300 RepID=A0A8K0UFB7_9AGAR|nr:hypothetical protein BXZ70DRAFT_630613 [Cristinia sonorae]